MKTLTISHLSDKQRNIVTAMEMIYSKEFSKSPNIDLQYKWLSTKDIATYMGLKIRNVREILMRVYLNGYKTGNVVIISKRQINVRLWSLAVIEGYTDSKYEDYVEREYE